VYVCVCACEKCPFFNNSHGSDSTINICVIFLRSFKANTQIEHDRSLPHPPQFIGLPFDRVVLLRFHFSLSQYQTTSFVVLAAKWLRIQSLLGCDTMSLVEWFPALWKKYSALFGYHLRVQRYFLSKCQKPSAQWESLTSQKTRSFIQIYWYFIRTRWLHLKVKMMVTPVKLLDVLKKEGINFNKDI
jgi:hypothetical protein